MRLEVLGRLPDPRPVVLEALARAFRPPTRMKVSEWAEQRRKISAESGAAKPGQWSNAEAPYLVDVMDALGPDDPAEDVVFLKSAQVGGSEVGVNFFGFVVEMAPGPMLIVLPSIDEATKYVRVKLQPTIDATPTLKRRVLEYSERSERGSTTSFKRFPGGFAQVTYAGSSKGLQMISARYTVAEELSEWPTEAGVRGDPAEQLAARTMIFERSRKRFWVSTPSVAGACRMSAKYQASDQRRYYVPCPHCGAMQVLRFERLKWASDAWPHGAYLVCAANGCAIEDWQRREIVQRGVWIPTAGEPGEQPPEWFEPGETARWRDRIVPGRVRGFHIWTAYSLFVSLDTIVAKYLGSREDRAQQAFTQQWLGEAWEEKGDAPDAEQLHRRRIEGLRKGRLAAGPLILTGAVDVQGNRLEWSVWGWSEGRTRWLTDWGIVEGDPENDRTWATLEREVLGRRYEIPGGTEVGVEMWGVDSGFATQAVYDFCRRRVNVLALKGMPGRNLPFLGTPTRVDVNWRGKRVSSGAAVWPVGTFALKSDLYGAIRRTLAGPDADGVWPAGAMMLPGDVDLPYCEQMTAEHLRAVEMRTGLIDYRWEKLAGRANEALDTACYARAMAFRLGIDGMSEAQWAKVRQERGAPPAEAQPDLFRVAVAPPEVAPPAAPDTIPKKGSDRAPERGGQRGRVGWLGPQRKRWL